MLGTEKFQNHKHLLITNKQASSKKKITNKQCRLLKKGIKLTTDIDKDKLLKEDIVFTLSNRATICPIVL